MKRKLRIAILLALCLTAPVLTSCEVSKDEPNPDGVSSCPTDCRCRVEGDMYIVQCDGEGGDELPNQ